tara:strand:- start:78 stop:872 length:795 start_codon:yes stop_codon:yes gene_type:complete
MTIVQSLWVGNDLTLLEIYSIRSFVKLGYEFHLYVYDFIRNIPKGVIIKDANEIMPRNTLFTLKNAYLPFSDIFRYKLLYEKGNYWVDVDLIALRTFDFTEPFVFSSERTIQKGAYKVKDKMVPNIGVLKAPPKSDFYKELYEKCMTHHKKGKNKDKIKYMRILRDMIKKYKYEKYVKKPHYFCHLDWWFAKDAFKNVASFKSKYGVRGHSINSMFGIGTKMKPYTIHLWRNLLTNKYKLNVNAKYHPNSLWEKLKKFVDRKDN